MQKEVLEIKVKRIGSSPYFRPDFLDNEKKALQSIGNISMLECNQNTDEIKNSSIIISNTHFKFNQSNLPLFDKVDLIIHSNSGYDNFELNFVKQFKGRIIIGNEIRANAVASYILTAFFKHYNQIPNQPNWSKDRSFDRPHLPELKIQLYGHGTVGKIVSKALQTLGCEPKIYDPYLNLNDEHQNEIDVVILCCGYNNSNHNFINEKFLKKLHSKSLIINPARGELINTKSLIEFLKKNPESFAYLDVFEQEPNDFTQFSNLTNINKTSHIAGVFSGIEQSTITFEKAIINDFLNLSSSAFNDKHKEKILKNKIIGNIII